MHFLHVLSISTTFQSTDMAETIWARSYNCFASIKSKSTLVQVISACKKIPKVFQNDQICDQFGAWNDNGQNRWNIGFWSKWCSFLKRARQIGLENIQKPKLMQHFCCFNMSSKLMATVVTPWCLPEWKAFRRVLAPRACSKCAQSARLCLQATSPWSGWAVTMARAFNELSVPLYLRGTAKRFSKK